MIRCGDALALLREIPDGCARCCVTSPPYWGLRDYGVSGQLGLERTPQEYVENLVAVFEQVRRVLSDDGTLWVNLGDSYCSVGGSQSQGTNGQMADRSVVRARAQVRDGKAASGMGAPRRPPGADGLKPKDLVGIPWRVAFALQEAGWYLRRDIIWAKPNPMPESVRDRPTSSHEYLFLLSKSQRYYYDATAIAENAVKAGQVIHACGTASKDRQDANDVNDRRTRIGLANWNQPCPKTRNARSVWTIPTRPFPEAHFATFPPELPRRCIAAGSTPGDLVLDPFAGAGTTGLVALRLGRRFLGIELNSEYAEMAMRRIVGDAPLLNGVEVAE